MPSFNNFDGKPETGRRGTPDFHRGLQSPYIDLPTKEQKQAISTFDEKINKAELAVVLHKSLSGQNDAWKAQAKKLNEEVAKLQKEKSTYIRQVRGAMVMRERKDINPAHIRRSG